METIIAHNKKGGVGKSSSTITLATILSSLGYKVALVDGDEQSNSTSLALPRRNFRYSLTDVVTREEHVSLHQAMVQVRKNLWVVPADKNLGSAQVFIRKENDFDVLTDRISELKETLKETPARDRFPWWTSPSLSMSLFQVEQTEDEEYNTPPDYLDFLFFDSPPHEDELTVSMLFASDKVIVPTELEEFSFQGLAQLIERIKQRFRHRTKKIEFAGILPNKVLHRPNHPMPLDYLASLYRHFPDFALRPIHFDPVISEAQGYHTTALELKSDSRAVKEFCALALEFIGYEGYLSGVPICNLCSATVSQVFEETENAG